MTAPATKPVSTCPVCGQMALVIHCDTDRCGWMTCRNTKCDAVLDVSNKRGHAIDFADRNKRRRVVLA